MSPLLPRSLLAMEGLLRVDRCHITLDGPVRVGPEVFFYNCRKGHASSSCPGIREFPNIVFPSSITDCQGFDGFIEPAIKPCLWSMGRSMKDTDRTVSPECCVLGPRPVLSPCPDRAQLGFLWEGREGDCLGRELLMEGCSEKYSAVQGP